MVRSASVEVAQSRRQDGGMATDTVAEKNRSDRGYAVTL
jgi:hypothetical protein